MYLLVDYSSDAHFAVTIMLRLQEVKLCLDIGVAPCGVWIGGFGFGAGYRSYRISLKAKRSFARPMRGNLLYGETPWKTFVELLQWVEWRTEDHFVELGSGTSRLSILLGVCGAKSCTAVELIPPFVSRARWIVERCALANVSIVQADMLEFSWSNADVIYLTATAFDESMMAEIAVKCDELRPGTTVICLTQIPDTTVLEVVDQRFCQFAWGMATVFWCRRVALAAKYFSDHSVGEVMVVEESKFCCLFCT